MLHSPSSSRSQADTPQHDVFLSYSRADGAIMQRVKADLEAEGLNVWIDQTGIPPGTANWRIAIQQAIRQTGCLLVIFSPDANESKWVAEEMDYAQVQDKHIFCILGRGHERDAIPFGYSRTQWIDIRDETKYVVGIHSLIAEICECLGVESWSPRRKGEYIADEEEAKKTADEQVHQHQAQKKVRRSVHKPVAIQAEKVIRKNASSPVVWRASFNYEYIVYIPFLIEIIGLLVVSPIILSVFEDDNVTPMIAFVIVTVILMTIVYIGLQFWSHYRTSEPLRGNLWLIQRSLDSDKNPSDIVLQVIDLNYRERNRNWIVLHARSLCEPFRHMILTTDRNYDYSEDHWVVIKDLQVGDVRIKEFVLPEGVEYSVFADAHGNEYLVRNVGRPQFLRGL